jgi:hypothetical protein
MNRLVRYMGGDPNIDVLNSTLSVRPIKQGVQDLCAVKTSGFQGPLKMVLMSRLGDRYRQCWERATGVEIPCDKPHVSETTYVRSSPSAESINCPARAAVYLGVGIEQFNAQLQNRQQTTGQTILCLVSVLGDNSLTSSVRDVRQNSLPLSPST